MEQGKIILDSFKLILPLSTQIISRTPFENKL